MKVRIPKEYERLPAAQKERLDEYYRNVAFNAAAAYRTNLKLNTNDKE